MSDLLERPLALRKNRPPHFRWIVRRHPELLHEKPDDCLDRDPACWKVNALQQAMVHSHVLEQPSPDLEMRRGVLVHRLTSVVVSKNPVVTSFVQLVLIGRLFDLKPVAPLVRLAVEDDRDSKIAAVVQWNEALIGRHPFNDHAITSSGADRQTDTDVPSERCELKQELHKIAERCEGFESAGAVLPI